MTQTDPELPHQVVKITKTTSVDPDKQGNPVTDNHNPEEQTPWGLTTELFAPWISRHPRPQMLYQEQLILMQDE